MEYIGIANDRDEMLDLVRNHLKNHRYNLLEDEYPKDYPSLVFHYKYDPGIDVGMGLLEDRFHFESRKEVVRKLALFEMDKN